MSQPYTGSNLSHISPLKRAQMKAEEEEKAIEITTPDSKRDKDIHSRGSSEISSVYNKRIMNHKARLSLYNPITQIPAKEPENSG